MPNPVTKAQLARIRGVSRPAIGKHCKPGGRLHAALLPGGKIDLDHEAVQGYLSDIDPAEVAKAAPKTAAVPTPPARKQRAQKAPPPPAAEVLEDELEGKPSSQDLRGMTVEQVADRFGHIVGFGEHVKVLKAIEETRRLELANEQTQGALIDREFVQIHVFGALRGLTRRLLRDAPKTLAKEIYSMALSGRPIEDAEKAIRDGIGSQIRETKTKAARALGGEGPAPAGDG